MRVFALLRVLCGSPFSGIPGLISSGDKLYPVPWVALKREPRKDYVILNKSPEEMKTAPSFGKDRLPDLADEQYARQVYGFYGMAPRATVFGERGGRKAERTAEERTSVRLPLKLKEGATYHWRMESSQKGPAAATADRAGAPGSDPARPGAPGQAREKATATEAGHDLWVKVQKIVGHTAQVEVMAGGPETARAADGREAAPTFTARITDRGHVLEFRARDASGPAADPAAGDRSGGETLARSLQVHLRQIAGDGLHDRPLVTGEIYHLPGMLPRFPGARQATGERPAGQVKPEESPRAQGGGGPGLADGARGGSGAERRLALRFEGTAPAGAFQVARFIVLAPEAGRGRADSRRPEAREGGGGADGEQARKDGEQDSQKEMGTVTYRLEDGLLERLDVKREVPQGDGAGITVRRMEESTKTGGE